MAASAISKYLLLVTLSHVFGVKRLATVNARIDGVLKDISKIKKPANASARLRNVLKELSGILINVSVTKQGAKSLSSVSLSRVGTLSNANVSVQESDQSVPLELSMTKRLVVVKISEFAQDLCPDHILYHTPILFLSQSSSLTLFLTSNPVKRPALEALVIMNARRTKSIVTVETVLDIDSMIIFY